MNENENAALPTALPEVLSAVLAGIKERLDSQQEQLLRLERLLARSEVKETYTTKEIAAKLGRSEWTVRQWCNRRQAKARKLRDGEWRIPHEELVRLQNDGPLTPEVEECR